jgi:tetratricopeptide (TPR) repeat protein
MVPRAAMLATKNRATGGLWLTLGIVCLFAGCTPPGPEALLDGKRLLEEGKYPEATERLRTATKLLQTNAQAWNYLGVAYQHTGQVTNAANAYHRALALERELVEARFNLGCLWSENNNPEAAKIEFTAYTLRRPQAAEGWTKLGFTQLRLRDVAGAEKSFAEALRISTNNPDALNGNGLALMQRNRPREAAQAFAFALKQQPNHAAALLNLARVTHVNLNDRINALNLYRQYLALEPKPENSEHIDAIARGIAQELAQQEAAGARSIAPPVAVLQTNIITQTQTNPQIVRTQAQVAVSRPVSNPPTQIFRTSAPTPVTIVQTQKPQEVVTLAPEPTIKPPSDAVTVVTQRVEQPAETPAEVTETAAAEQPEKRGFFQRMNPANLFRRDKDETPSPTPLPPGVTTNNQVAGIVAPQTSTPQESSPPKVARYKYVTPSKPELGKRADAERTFALGVTARDASRWSEAARQFGRAVNSDPSYFDAQFNLAVAQFQLGDYKKSLPTWEHTLALQPDSADARYNFGMALKNAGYPLDAANELEKLALTKGNETRAHLALGNLYAEELRNKTMARTHYLRVLELSPSHPQSSAIRYWLVSNPQ